ncbi:MAG: MBL fold metallo-hydrolase [Xanthobacteraceae bacterium]
MKASTSILLAVTASLAISTAGILLPTQRDAARADEGTILITLGTAGGPLPRKDRAQSSNLLVVNGTPYLIDAGGSVTSRIVQSGNDFRKVKKIFITHPHSDHSAGLATLMVSQWEYQATEPTDIYGGGVEALVNGALEYLKPNADIRWAEGKKRPMADSFHGHDVGPGVVYQDANVKVTAVENTQLNSSPVRPLTGSIIPIHIVLIPRAVWFSLPATPARPTRLPIWRRAPISTSPR